PRAAGAGRLRSVDQHRIDPQAAHTDIIDRALRGAELCPRPLPGVPELDASLRATADRDRNEEHGLRALNLPVFNAEELRGAGAIEQDSKIGDITIGPDLL